MKLSNVIKNHNSIIKSGLALITVIGATLALSGCVNNTDTKSVKITNPSTHRVVKSIGWHKGTPKILQKTGTWISQPKPITKNKNFFNKKAKSVDFAVFTKNGFGIDPIQRSLDRNNHVIATGADSSVFATINPHYRILNKNLIQLTSGGVYNPEHVSKNSYSSQNSLKYELNGTFNHSYGGTWLIKINSNHTFTLWGYNHSQGIGSKRSFGTFIFQK